MADYHPRAVGGFQVSHSSRNGLVLVYSQSIAVGVRVFGVAKARAIGHVQQGAFFRRRVPFVVDGGVVFHGRPIYRWPRRFIREVSHPLTIHSRGARHFVRFSGHVIDVYGHASGASVWVFYGLLIMDRQRVRASVVRLAVIYPQHFTRSNYQQGIIALRGSIPALLFGPVRLRVRNVPWACFNSSVRFLGHFPDRVRRPGFSFGAKDAIVVIISSPFVATVHVGNQRGNGAATVRLIVANRPPEDARFSLEGDVFMFLRRFFL